MAILPYLSLKKKPLLVEPVIQPSINFNKQLSCPRQVIHLRGLSTTRTDLKLISQADLNEKEER